MINDNHTQFALTRRVVWLGLACLVTLIHGLFPVSALSPVPKVTARTAQSADKPFALPFVDPPSPTTWMIDQGFGNTIGAFNYGRYWYAAGQGLHFGLDFTALCGTPIRAIGDGEVDNVDNFSLGLEPHNLAIFHREYGVVSIYGHLQVKSDLVRGQPVRRGDVIGVVGDPDLTCVSRPHLHLEIRDNLYRNAFNPAKYIAADWDGLASIGYHRYGGYTKNLLAPNAAQTWDTQSDIDFNAAALNNYAIAYPLPARFAASPYTRPAFTAPPTTETSALETVSKAGCCSWAWWAESSAAIRFWDGPDGQPATIFEHALAGGDPAPIESYPLTFRSPNEAYAFRWEGARVALVNRVDGAVTPIATGGALPSFSPDQTRILWQRFPADDIPGAIPPSTEVSIANVDGSNRKLVLVQPGGQVFWLDNDRLLLVEPIRRDDKFKLTIYTISRNSFEVMLPEVGSMRGLAVAPGGKHVLLYAPFQPDPAVSGLYLLETTASARANKLPFFGSYRWRDSTSFLYIPYQPGAPSMQLALYDLGTGTSRSITDPAAQPFRVANDDWSVSPNGQMVLFWEASDLTLRILKMR